MDIIKYTNDMLRPELGDTEIEVHKLADQVWNRGVSVSAIVNDYYLKNGVTEITKHKNAEELVDEYSDNELPPRMTESDVMEALNYADSNESLIRSIIEEDKKLKSMIFTDDKQIRSGESVEEDLQEYEFKYYNIEFEQTDGGFHINWSQNEV